ncbi:short-chain dehydrogenase/reductase-like protein SDR [Lentithecium fluviatile CBS 122367]|uniref:Short-chain dehydrogenase/reductase-like protein SDR n=1 Tax=Lentithecium fluviatile CBS 122367 TaxID=1168545 RepID=A0A6G1IEQ5_9PLEO|nr:short-chain dehydrogenase/reductase-like protein SDR [Lentithecium fluviatile CBS 122367]
MSRTRTIISFGSGPGISNHTISHFASHGFNHAILLARNTQRLENDDAPFVQKASSNPNLKVDTITLDLSNLSAIPAALKKIEDLTQGEDVEVVFFNAARIKLSGMLEVPVGEIEEDFKTTNLALYLIAQWAIPRLITLSQTIAKSASPSTSKPSLLVTNSHLPWDPVPSLLSLSLVKASQRNMVQSFNRAFGGSGIHVGLISVEGVVAPENKELNPVNIGEKVWEFFEGGEGLEVNIRD